MGGTQAATLRRSGAVSNLVWLAVMRNGSDGLLWESKKYMPFSRERQSGTSKNTRRADRHSAKMDAA